MGVKQQKVLVTGGAGYIGSHLVKLLDESDYEVTVIDDLSSGVANRLASHIRFLHLDILDMENNLELFRSLNLDSVIHLAAKKSVSESVQFPDLYNLINVTGTLRVIEICNKLRIPNLVFSSTCAVYGENTNGVVSEKSPLKPESPYGQSKLDAEELIQNYFFGDYVILRYFNVVGTASPKLSDKNPDALFPALFSAIRNDRVFQIFGCDYPTEDGTCERDYIDVRDLAQCHLNVLEKLKKSTSLKRIYNIGTGEKISVLKVVRTLEELLGREIGFECRDRRSGDVPSIWTRNEIAMQELDFNSVHSIEASLKSMLSDF